MATSHLSENQLSLFQQLQQIIDQRVDEELSGNRRNMQVLVAHHGGVIPAPEEYDRVFGNVYIGRESIARDKLRLAREGFTHVINCSQGKRFGQVDTDQDFYTGTNISYLGIPGHDSVKFDISQHFQQAADFMKSCQNEGKILVHCHQGISRSAAVTIGCLMINHKMSAANALRSILKHRIVMPNQGFLRRLAIFQDKLIADEAAGETS